MNFIFVALGGAFGAVLRYAISLIPMPIKTNFPFLTLLTNIIGAVLIGFIVGIVNKSGEVSPLSVLFWKTGVCGGFTTFSTFSFEAVTLFEKKLYFLSFLYISLSVVACTFGFICGRKIATVFC